MSDRAPLLPPSAPNEQPPPYNSTYPGPSPAGTVSSNTEYKHPPPAQGGQYGTYSGPPGYQPTISQQPTYIQTPPVTATSVIVVGGCPACRVGVLQDQFTWLGICCAIWFFPIGILFCLLMRQKQCPNCGAIFG